MDVNRFLNQVLEALSKLDFVENVDFKTDVFVLRGKVFLDKEQFLQIYVNDRTGTIAFALVEKDKRIWGIDFDSLRGWHLHPMDNPDGHVIIKPQSIEEIVAVFADAWNACSSKS